MTNPQQKTRRCTNAAAEQYAKKLTLVHHNDLLVSSSFNCWLLVLDYSSTTLCAARLDTSTYPKDPAAVTMVGC